MTKVEFHQLFAAALERATQHAEKRWGSPSRVVIVLSYMVQGILAM